MPPRDYNQGLSTALAANQLIPTVALSAVEILTYFPLHLQWPSLTVRLLRAGFRGPEIAKAQLHARGVLNRVEFDRRKAALRHAILTAGRSFFGDQSFTQTSYANDPRMQPIVAASYTNGDCVAHYDGTEIDTVLSSLRSEPPTLQQVANGVTNHPTGNDAGVLTQVIEWATAAGQLPNYTTDDVPMLAEQLAGTWVNEPAIIHSPHWDQTGLATVQAIVNP